MKYLLKIMEQQKQYVPGDETQVLFNEVPQEKQIALAIEQSQKSYKEEQNKQFIQNNEQYIVGHIIQNHNTQMHKKTFNDVIIELLKNESQDFDDLDKSLSMLFHGTKEQINKLSKDDCYSEKFGPLLLQMLQMVQQQWTSENLHEAVPHLLQIFNALDKYDMNYLTEDQCQTIITLLKTDFLRFLKIFTTVKLEQLIQGDMSRNGYSLLECKEFHRKISQKRKENRTREKEIDDVYKEVEENMMQKQLVLQNIICNNNMSYNKFTDKVVQLFHQHCKDKPDSEKESKKSDLIKKIDSLPNTDRDLAYICRDVLPHMKSLFQIEKNNDIRAMPYLLNIFNAFDKIPHGVFLKSRSPVFTEERQNVILSLCKEMMRYISGVSKELIKNNIKDYFGDDYIRGKLFAIECYPLYHQEISDSRKNNKEQIEKRGGFLGNLGDQAKQYLQK